MRSLQLFALCASLLAVASTGSRAFAQVPSSARAPQLELTYDYIHTNGPPGNCGCFGMNGGGAAFVLPLTASNFDLTASIDITHAGNIGAPMYDFTLTTYGVGTRYNLPLHTGMLHTYLNGEVGGAHAGGSLASHSGSGIGSAYSVALGGGVDLHLRGRLSLKLIEADYLNTLFDNGDTNHQNNLRLRAGIRISLGHAH